MRKQTVRRLIALGMVIFALFSLSACTASREPQVIRVDISIDGGVDLPFLSMVGLDEVLFPGVGQQTASGSASAQQPSAGSSSGTAQQPSGNTPSTPDTPAQQPSGNSSGATSGGQTSGGQTSGGQSSGEQPSGGGTPLSYSKEELLNYFNTNVNKIKSEKPGFTREEAVNANNITLSNSLANSVIGLIQDSILPKDTEVSQSAKGQNCDTLVPVETGSYVSQLTISDIQDITVKQDGSGYTVTVTMPDAQSPALGGPYDRIFDFITIDDVYEKYVPEVGATVDKANITTSFSGCTATATFNENGQVTFYETNIPCSFTLTDASISILKSDVTLDLVVRTTFTDFAW